MSDDDYMNYCVQDSGNPETESYSRKRVKKQLEALSKSKKSKQQIVREEYAKQEPIKQDNKGFQMLQKLGFKAGSSLGTGGITEPIKVEFKNNRTGLGKEITAKVRTEQDSKRKGQQQQFLNTMSDKFDLKLIETDLRKAQLAIMAADEQEGIKSKFWLQQTKSLRDIDGYSLVSEEIVEDPAKLEFEQLDTEEKLETCVKYLRQEYYYCIWCGCRYDDTNDLLTNCPGTSRDDHDDD